MNAHAVTDAAHDPRERVPAGRCLGRGVGAHDIEQRSEARQLDGDVLGEPVAQEALVGITRRVGERTHDDRGTTAPRFHGPIHAFALKPGDHGRDANDSQGIGAQAVRCRPRIPAILAG
ncbi:MAG: hypothetical protein WD673_11035 [Alphaproteobacteria bacterium]